MAEESSSKGIMIGGILALVVLVMLIGGYAINTQNKATQLQRELENTQQQLEGVIQETVDAKQNVIDEVGDQAQNIAESIGDVDSPAMRLALMKQYLTGLLTALRPESQEQLDTVVIYVQKNPTVLVQPDQLPAEYATTLTNLKQELSAARAQAVAVIKQAVVNSLTPTPVAVVGKSYTITGTLSYVETDPILGGSYFMLTDTNYGEPFFLYLSPTNSVQVQESMVDELVTVQVKVTGVEDDYVTYTVVSGPTLATATPTVAPVVSPTATTTSSEETQ